MRYIWVDCRKSHFHAFVCMHLALGVFDMQDAWCGEEDEYLRQI
jgi:hypothetical protein